MRHVVLRVGGMSCDHCLHAVRAALTALPSVTVDSLTFGSVTVQFDPAVATVDQLVAAIDDAGYQVLEPVPWRS